MSTATERVRQFGPVTSCRVDLPSGRVHVQGCEGERASVVVRVDADGSSDPDIDGLVAVTHEDGVLSIQPGTKPWGRGLLGLVAVGPHDHPTVDLLLPRDAKLVIRTVGGDMSVHGCGGGQTMGTVTGEVVVAEATGRVEVRSVSGQVAVAGRSLDVDVSSTSGRVRIDDQRAARVRVRSVSGDVELHGGVATDGPSRVETLSGDVSVVALEGVTLMPRTVSGRVAADEGARREIRHGATALVVGDGSAELHVRSVSGNIRLARSPRAAGGDGRSGPGDPMLDALEALSRGEISVEEADRRLGSPHG
ncbi:MAG: DUF4097 family beta strand repeat-containing protein [Chloroflexota bacterium]